METRPVGRTSIRLSVVGLGTAQLQMMPERQAVETLVRGFGLGVNWVHTAPDYGGIDPWIRRAIEIAGREVMVLSAGSPLTKDLPAFFENTCHVYGTRRLALYGIAGVDDIEWFGENLWDRGGMIEYLQEKKAEGRLGGIYCSTHGDADHVARLIESGIFDAVMLAWNPLGFHQQSQLFARRRIGRGYEDLSQYQSRIFPLAAERGVSLLIMKPFAGGLLCRGKALPPHDWFADGIAPADPGDILRLVLEQPGVAAVLPGAASPEEAEENAAAGHTANGLTAARRGALASAAAEMRTRLCSRCGDCETTCSHALAIPAMFRDAYIWTSRNETSMANASENYFDLHPAGVLACVTCAERTCLCPQGLDVPAALVRVDTRMHALRGTRQHPGPSAEFAQRTIDGRYRVLVLTADVPARVTPGEAAVARFLLRNRGPERWPATQHVQDGTPGMAVGVSINGTLTAAIPLRNTICPDDASPVVFEFPVPSAPGAHAVTFVLLPTDAASPSAGTPFHSAIVTVAGGEDGRYGVAYLEHSIPLRMKTGVAYGARLTFGNTGTMTWAARGGGRVEVLIAVDDIPLAVVPLHADVPPGGRISLHQPFRADDIEGRHRVQVELVHRGVTTFADAGVPPWTFEVTTRRAAWTETVRLAEIERRHNPWHYNPFSSVVSGRDGEPFPLFVSRAKGCRIWDAEGNEFLDYSMGWGSTVLGYADDRIQDAIRAMLDTGAVLPAPHPIEMDVSRMLLDAFPPNDMVAFGKNGSDVCTIAARLARVVTGRRTILSSGFHGWQDFGLEYFEFPDCGIPFRDERCLYKFTPGDRAGFLALFDRHKDDLAAVMVEPAAALIDEEAGLSGEADADYLRTIADAAHQAGALLIFDEIKTGFRYRQGSVQAATGVMPDLTCLGKALASGMPLSALIGPSRLFLDGFHKTHFCPTFRGEVYSLAAARAALPIYRDEPVVDHVWRHGARLREAILAAARDARVAGRCSGAPFHLLFVFDEPDGQRRRLKRTLLMQELLKARVYTVGGMMLPSYAHDDKALEQATRAYAHAFAIIAHADRTGQLSRYVDLPLL
jgi:glutamate-1-semialdehyde 2,1-aminomutase